MKKTLFIIYILSIFSSSVYAYATEASIRNYQNEFCKDMSDSALKKDYNTSKTTLDKYIADGSKNCKHAGDTFNTQEAQRKGKQLFDACESYRYGAIREEIYKLKIRTKALKKEIDERGKK